MWRTGGVPNEREGRHDRRVADLRVEVHPRDKGACEAADGVNTSAVYHTLLMAVKYRQAEKRVVEPKPGIKVAEWRRAP